MLLYPRLPQTVAAALAAELSSKSIKYLFGISSVSHPEGVYAATGGNRVTETHLEEIQSRIREIACEAGYPALPDDMKRRGFDASSGHILHEIMGITPAEASIQGVWAFIACVILPDIVRWRFPGASNMTSKERFLGGSRGLRNTFGRVWWRAYILHQPGSSRPYEFLDLLGEDELVQITERPGLAGSPFLAKQVCRAFLGATCRYPEISRSDLLRDAMKRLRRLLPLVAFDALDDQVLGNLVDEILTDSITSLSAVRVL